jgi:hypothetical protein
MTCGITVAPRMPVASSTLSVPANWGVKSPARTLSPSGLAYKTCKAKAMSITPTMEEMTASSGLKPRRCRVSMPKTPTPVSNPAGNKGMPKSKFKASAAPMNSARSVAIAMTSA